MCAAIAQLVEHQLPKLGVAGSSPVGRSKALTRGLFCKGKGEAILLDKINDDVRLKRGNTNVGIVNLGGVTYVIDTGSSTKFAKELLLEIGEGQKIILNTHSHADHIQGNRAFENAGAKVYASESEVPFIRNPQLEGFYLYGANPPKALRLSFYKAKPSNARSFDEISLPSQFELISLPGHSSGMTAIKAEDVIFCGDAYFGLEVLEKYSYPYLIDVKKFLDSLNTLEKIDAEWYVPSHGEPTNDPHVDIEKTRAAVHDFIDATLESLNTQKYVEEICANISEKMSIQLNTGTFYLFRSFVSANLSYLEMLKEIEQVKPGLWQRTN